jgi:hypothetical protein
LLLRILPLRAVKPLAPVAELPDITEIMEITSIIEDIQSYRSSRNLSANTGNRKSGTEATRYLVYPNLDEKVFYFLVYRKRI